MTRWSGRMRTWMVVGLCCLAKPAHAQIGAYHRPQVNRPTVSPALNLRSANPVTSYFGVVRPQQETANTLQQLQQDFGALPGNSQTAATEQGQMQQAVGQTGHGVSFSNTRQFFSGPNNRFSLGSASGDRTGSSTMGGPTRSRPVMGVPVTSGLMNRR